MTEPRRPESTGGPTINPVVAQAAADMVNRDVHECRMLGLSEDEMKRLAREKIAKFLKESPMSMVDQETVSAYMLFAYDTAIAGKHEDKPATE
jgi:hypothetical protein